MTELDAPALQPDLRPLAGARCPDARPDDDRAGRHGSQSGPADALEVARRLRVAAPMVRHRLHPGSRRGDAARRTAGRSLRPQDGPRRGAGRLRDHVGGLRLRAQRECVHRRPHRAGRRRGRAHGHVALRRDGPLLGGRAAAGDGHLGCRQLPGPAARPDRRRLRAVSLLVGLGLPDERAGRADRPGCRRRVRAAVPQRATAKHRHPGRGTVERGTGPADVRPGRGRRQRLGLGERHCPVDRSRGDADGLRPVGGVADRPAKRPSRWSIWGSSVRAASAWASS